MKLITVAKVIGMSPRYTNYNGITTIVIDKVPKVDYWIYFMIAYLNI